MIGQSNHVQLNEGHVECKQTQGEKFPLAIFCARCFSNASGCNETFVPLASLLEWLWTFWTLTRLPHQPYVVLLLWAISVPLVNEYIEQHQKNNLKTEFFPFNKLCLFVQPWTRRKRSFGNKLDGIFYSALLRWQKQTWANPRIKGHRGLDSSRWNTGLIDGSISSLHKPSLIWVPNRAPRILAVLVWSRRDNCFHIESRGPRHFLFLVMLRLVRSPHSPRWSRFGCSPKRKREGRNHSDESHQQW